MKDLYLTLWLSRLGMNVSIPLAGFVLLGQWLHYNVGWGRWTIWAGIVTGTISAVVGFRSSLRALAALEKHKEDGNPPPVSFGDHL